MIEQFDQKVFLFLNSLNTPFWDRVMSAISLIGIWVPMYIAILVWMGFRYRKKFPVVLFFIILAVTMNDQLSLLIKNIVLRPRPCHEPALDGLVHMVDGKCGGMYGFVSSHASNSFNAAMLSLLFLERRWCTVSILIWAAVVGYSRIYLGVHYPGDVVCGSLLGLFIGWSFHGLYIMTDKYILRKSPVPEGTGESGRKTRAGKPEDT